MIDQPTDPPVHDESDEHRDGCRDDNSPVERYRESPGIGLFTDEDPPEPNEPG